MYAPVLILQPCLVAACRRADLLQQLLHGRQSRYDSGTKWRSGFGAHRDWGLDAVQHLGSQRHRRRDLVDVDAEVGPALLTLAIRRRRCEATTTMTRVMTRAQTLGCGHSNQGCDSSTNPRPHCRWRRHYVWRRCHYRRCSHSRASSRGREQWRHSFHHWRWHCSHCCRHSRAHHSQSACAAACW